MASDLLEFYSTNSLSWDKLEYDTDAIQNLHYGLIHVGLPIMVDLNKDKLPNIMDGNTPKNYELCQEGDVAFADASEDTNEVAKVVEFYNLGEKKVICGLHTIHGRDRQGKTVVGYKGCMLSLPQHSTIKLEKLHKEQRYTLSAVRISQNVTLVFRQKVNKQK